MLPIGHIALWKVSALNRFHQQVLVQAVAEDESGHVHFYQFMLEKT